MQKKARYRQPMHLHRITRVLVVVLLPRTRTDVVISYILDDSIDFHCWFKTLLVFVVVVVVVVFLFVVLLLYLRRVQKKASKVPSADAPPSHHACFYSIFLIIKLHVRLFFRISPLLLTHVPAIYLDFIFRVCNL